MGLFRKRGETYNEQMLRGLVELQHEEPELGPEPTMLARAGLPDGTGVGPAEWDTGKTVRAPGLTGGRVEFTSLPNSDLIVDGDNEPGDLSPLADAIEQDVKPPYKAVAAHQDGDLWGVVAKRIDVARFAFPAADSLDLSRRDSWEEFRVDGEASQAAVPPQLRAAGERAGADFYAKAERVDGDFWEVRVSAL